MKSSAILHWDSIASDLCPWYWYVATTMLNVAYDECDFQGPSTRQASALPLRIYLTTASLTNAKAHVAFVQVEVSVSSTRNRLSTWPLMANSWVNTLLVVRLGDVVISVGPTSLTINTSFDVSLLI